MRHALFVALMVAGPLFKCTGAHASDKYPRACKAVRAQLIQVMQRDPDAYDLTSTNKTVVRYACDDVLDDAKILCLEATKLGCE